MIYLDNAATTFPKPPRVAEEVTRCIKDYCGNPGRGAHRLSLLAAETVYACREALSELFGLGAPERILFTANTTYALNMVIKGFLCPGDHVLISELEHNAVRRPLCRLAEAGYITYDTFPVVGRDSPLLLRGIEERITPRTAAVICTHASNICSITLPLTEIGKLCHRHRVKFIVDAAQSAGRLPLSMKQMHIDALAAPGHKSLFGIQGCGVLALAPDMEPATIIEGGSGADSRSPDMPEEPPERYEAGTLSTPAIAGLLAGIEFLSEMGLSEIERRESELFSAALERLRSLEGITVYEPQAVGAILLFNRKGMPATEVARLLDRSGICVRAGLHCAPLAHQALGTPEGGAVRVSFGPFNTLADTDALWQALK